MRQITRTTLSAATQTNLQIEQSLIDRKMREPEFSADSEWKRLRQRVLLKDEVLGQLRSMAGERERCMYCSDSHGNDIEHFWPKADYPARMLVWENLLLCCSSCGRHKGRKFPLQNGQPLMIDPSAECPWQFLDFEPTTGILSARFAADGTQELKGAVTVEILKLAGDREAVARGYLRSFRRVAALISEYLQHPTTAEQLARDLQNTDDHGVSGWVLHGTGSFDEPFASLKRDFKGVWQSLLDRL